MGKVLLVWGLLIGAAWTQCLPAPYACEKGIALPSKKLTPGVVRTTDAKEICAKGFRTKPYRLTTSAMKKQVCREYGVKNCPRQGAMEIDHLIPLELGGLDDVKNLWPQMAPQFHQKDQLENELKREVCSGEIKLTDAQKCISQDWLTCYQKVVKGGKK